MTFLPIVARELRVAARRRGTYWVRLAAALAALGVGGFIMLFTDLRSPQRLGILLFVWLSIISYCYSLLAGIFTTADCLSEEKREGTLGLLFLTDLKGYDIVLGKLAATSLNAFYGMLAIFPVMAISLLAGGVTGGEFWRVVLVSVNNLLFSLAVGMFCSAISKDERKSIVLAFLIVFFFTGLVPFFGFFLSHWSRVPPVCCILSPGFACFTAFDATYRTLKAAQWNVFYQSLSCVHGMAWALLAAAAIVVPRTWQDRAESPGRTRFRQHWQRWAHGSAATRLAVRRRLLEINPFYWLTGRDRMKAILVWLLLGCGALLWAWGLWQYPADWKENAYVWTGIIASRVLKFWIAMEACRRFGADRKSGALELLLATPLRVKEILWGQMLGLFKQFAGPAATVLVVDFIFLLTERNGDEWNVPVGVADMIMFVADLITLSWVGMWLGLTSRHANRAAGATLVRVLVLPWFVFGVLMTGIALAPASSRVPMGGLSENQFAVLSWILIGLVNNLFFGSWARYRLVHEFRNIATQRVDVRSRLSRSRPAAERRAN